MSERDIQQNIQVAWTKLGGRLFRINTGTGWVGKTFRPSSRQNVSVSPQDIVVFNARPLHAGFPGCSDLIGWRPLIITADMVGKRIAVFAAIEVKSQTGRPTAQQRAFIEAVNFHGGHGRIARSIDEAAS